jgi:hypothetical protein
LNVASSLLLSLALLAPAYASDAPADPPKPTTFAEKLVADMRRLVDAAIVARPPKLVPPKKLALAYKLAKVGTLDLGAPLVTLAAADLDGDGRGELYAVTAHDVIAIGIGADKKPRELGRVAFTGDRAVGAPRDVVGTATLAGDGAALVASASTYLHSLRVSWSKGVLVGAPDEPGFLLCAGERAQLAPGRNYFGDSVTGSYGARCTNQLVDADGYPLRARAQLSLASKLDVSVERCAAKDLGCQPTARHEVANVGVAFEVADVDRDGTPEVLYAAAGAPGDPDVLRVVSLGDDEKKPKLKKTFTAGGVAGIAVADLDGNAAPEAIVAVRLVGASRVDLWRLE